MRILGVHPPDPNHPAGMAFVFAAGIVDPRPGGYPKKHWPNQLWALKESWEPTSKMWWELGFRYHPELATKWIEGGGQFTVGRIVDTPPEEDSMEELAAQFAAEQFSAMKDEIDRVVREGDPVKIKRLKQRYRQASQQAGQFADMINVAIEAQKGL